MCVAGECYTVQCSCLIPCRTDWDLKRSLPAEETPQGCQQTAGLAEAEHSRFIRVHPKVICVPRSVSMRGPPSFNQSQGE